MEPTEALEIATRNLKSWAFHEEHHPLAGSQTDEGLITFSQLQERSYYQGVQLLKQLVEKRPLQFTVGKSPLIVHDPIEWLKNHPEVDLHNPEAAADFYEPTLTFAPESKMKLNDFVRLAAPGEKVPDAYFGNQGTCRYISAEALAGALLIEGSSLSSRIVGKSHPAAS